MLLISFNRLLETSSHLLGSRWHCEEAVFVGLNVKRTEKSIDFREVMVKFLEKVTAWPEAAALKRIYERDS